MQNCQKTRELKYSNCSGAFAATPGKGELAQAVLSRQGHVLQHHSSSPRQTPCCTSRQTTRGAPQNGWAVHRGVEEHPRGWDLALLQAQAPTSPGSGHGLQEPWCFQEGFGAHRRDGWNPPCRCTAPCGSPQQGLLSAHPSKVILAAGTAPEISCHFTALQLLMFISVPSANLPEHSSSFDTCCICVWFQHHSDALVSGQWCLYDGLVLLFKQII